MNSFNRISFNYITILLLILFTGCTDDFDYKGSSNIRPGESNIDMTLSFVPYSSISPTRATVAPPGDGMREITDFAILVYDLDGNLISMHGASNVEGDKGDFSDLIFSTVQRTDSDASPGNTTTEPETGQASFKWKINQWGEYYIYVAANMGRWNGDNHTSTVDELKNNYSEDIKTVDRLKSIKLTWDQSNYRNNRQMLGFFTTDNAHHEDAPIVKINQPSIKLHAWLKRAASKVTIDFDGSGLRENVIIYLKQAVIRNIPKNCFLGKTNTPKDTTETLYATETFRLTNTKNEYGHHLDYFAEGKESNYKDWPFVAKSNPHLDHPDAKHDDEAHALFFYENCQGNFSDHENKQKYDKRQYPADDGTVLDYTDMRDNVPAGTYIEVEGWYQNNNPKEAGNGRIIYRFMLGKDVEYDFNAERNTHYKVTLKFKGNGNDFDWHIDYKEDQGFGSPNPYFISYLYDEGMVLPLRYNGDLTGKKIKGEIIESNWYPKDAKGKNIYFEGYVQDDGPWNGFLSLQKTVKADIGKDKKNDSGYNKKYWEGNGEGDEKVTPRGVRIYDTKESATPYGDATNGYYSVDYDKDKKTTYIGVPLFTRAKTLVSRTGFTGNNPYSAYRRYAKVRFTIVDANTEKPVNQDIPGNTIDIEIIQVTRIVNPKAIYRSDKCDKEFNVVLTKLLDESDSEFTKIQSIGPWSAKIEYGKEWFIIKGDGKNSKNIGNDSIKGGSGSDIAFTYKPNGENTSGSPRCGIILVRYHNETCVHRIFVRQGYDPIKVMDNSITVHTFNLRTKDEEVSNPLDEGSLFRFGPNALDYPIDASNNYADGFADHTETPLKIADSDTPIAWKNIPTQVQTEKYSQFVLKDNKGQGRLLKKTDIDNMKSNMGVGYGFGVVYGDESTETAMSVQKAYEFRSSSKSTSGYGIRCLVIYNKNDGRNVIFPIGASGYGRRKYGNYYDAPSLLYTREFKNFEWDDNDFRSGVVRYAHRSLPMDKDKSYGSTQYRPLLWDLYRRPGANYWFNEYSGGNGALDINYFTFDTGSGDSNHCQIVGFKEQSDACYLRLVED